MATTLWVIAVCSAIGSTGELDCENVSQTYATREECRQAAELLKENSAAIKVADCITMQVEGGPGNFVVVASPIWPSTELPSAFTLNACIPLVVGPPDPLHNTDLTPDVNIAIRLNDRKFTSVSHIKSDGKSYERGLQYSVEENGYRPEVGYVWEGKQVPSDAHLMMRGTLIWLEFKKPKPYYGAKGMFRYQEQVFNGEDKHRREKQPLLVSSCDQFIFEPASK